MNQERLRNIIAQDLDFKKSVDPKYSLRSYCRDLGVNPTSISLFLRGKRHLSDDTIQVFATNLHLSEEVLSQAYNYNYSQKEFNRDYECIEIENLHLVSEWYCFALLSLMETEGFTSDVSWIADQLGLKKSVVSSTIKKLLDFGLISQNSIGQLIGTDKKFTIPAHYKSFTNRKIHLQNLELAKKSLEEDDVSTRDFSSISLAIDPDKIEPAREKIKKFRRQLAEFLEGGSKKKVYRMCVQLFPIQRQK